MVMDNCVAISLLLMELLPSPFALVSLYVQLLSPVPLIRSVCNHFGYEKVWLHPQLVPYVGHHEAW